MNGTDMTERNIIVAEGDSWFHYPNRESSAPEENFVGILHELRGLFGYRVKTVAKFGDTLWEMATVDEQQNALVAVLKDLEEKGEVPRAILFSAGGNDLIEVIETGNGKQIRVLQTLLNSDKPELNVGKVNELLETLRGYYEILVRQTMDSCREIFTDIDIPIFLHGYAEPVPDGSSFSLIGFNSGPWLYPAFENLHYGNLAENTGIMADLVGMINRMLSEFVEGIAKTEGNLVHYVDLRHCVSNSLEINSERFYGLKVPEYKLDWENELHPTSEGFRRIAFEIYSAIEGYYSNEGIG